ncbi:MAG: hypothetical protein DWQ36_10730 [Acidobacteria bacterium]|nr:MAG: hypothetical protein DWQ30_12675 [Acidobacteriota bacterium]REK07687.1 MAG: hypothetical protein DWQ36_10730 [Acidobacteriota bacterium]
MSRSAPLRRRGGLAALAAPLVPLTVLSAVLVLALGCGETPDDANASSEVEAAGPSAAFAALEPGWNKFSPGGETICSDGSPFHFFARPGDPDKVVFYLQGGGACWTGATCDRDLEPTYAIQAVAELIEPVAGQERSERTMSGIFDFTREDNPLRDYSFVFVPYCSGDVHIGNQVSTYQAPETEEHAAHEVEVHHKGWPNVKAALDWTFGTFPSPETVVVTGSSAGSIPSPFYAHEVKEHYPEARVVQLGDGSGGYRRTEGAALPHVQWGTLAVLGQEMPYFADMAPEDYNYEHLYIATGRQHPDVQLAEYDAAEDAVQVRFLQIGGAQVPTLQSLLDLNRADVAAEVPGFVSFTAGGDSHTILGRDFFYTFKVGDTTFRDWFAALVAGEPVQSVHCRDAAAGCAEAETVAVESTEPEGEEESGAAEEASSEAPTAP